MRVRLFGGKGVRRRYRFKRACPETKGLRSLAVRPLSGKCRLPVSVLVRAPTSIKDVL